MHVLLQLNVKMPSEKVLKKTTPCKSLVKTLMSLIELNSPTNLIVTIVDLLMSSIVLQCFACTFPNRLSYSLYTLELLFCLAKNSAYQNNPLIMQMLIQPLAWPATTNMSFLSPNRFMSRQVTACPLTLLSDSTLISCSELSKSRTDPSELPLANMSSKAAIE